MFDRVLVAVSGLQVVMSAAHSLATQKFCEPNDSIGKCAVDFIKNDEVQVLLLIVAAPLIHTLGETVGKYTSRFFNMGTYIALSVAEKVVDGMVERIMPNLPL